MSVESIFCCLKILLFFSLHTYRKSYFVFRDYVGPVTNVKSASSMKRIRVKSVANVFDSRVQGSSDSEYIGLRNAFLSKDIY